MKKIIRVGSINQLFGIYWWRMLAQPDTTAATAAAIAVVVILLLLLLFLFYCYCCYYCGAIARNCETVVCIVMLLAVLV